MKLPVLLLVLLLTVGCSTLPKPPAPAPGGSKAAPAPQYVSRDAAIAAALSGTTDAQLGDAKFVENYRYDNPLSGPKELPVWIVDLVSKGDLRPRSRVLVDAVTGKVLSVSDPPSGY